MLEFGVKFVDLAAIRKKMGLVDVHRSQIGLHLTPRNTRQDNFVRRTRSSALGRNSVEIPPEGVSRVTWAQEQGPLCNLPWRLVLRVNKRNKTLLIAECDLEKIEVSKFAG
jgi:hypothetical protein